MTQKDVKYRIRKDKNRIKQGKVIKRLKRS